MERKLFNCQRCAYSAFLRAEAELIVVY